MINIPQPAYVYWGWSKMKIMRFTGKQIHGYMNFDIKFNGDISFLTGINGTGKTTIVQCLYALISPSIRILSNIDYESIEVAIKLDGQARFTRISTLKKETGIIISTNMTKQVLSVPVLQNLQPSTSEEANEFYNDFLARNSDNEVLQYIRELPSPMFLGIERRAGEEDTTRQRTMTFAARRRAATTIATYSQRQSLLEARDIARDSYSEIRDNVMELMESLRTQILLSALKYVNVSNVTFSQVQEMLSVDMEKTIRMIINTAEDLRIPTNDVEKELKLFSHDINTNRDKLAGYLDDENKLLGVVSKDQEKARAFYGLLANTPHFQRINTIFKHVQNYITNNQKAYERIKQFQDIVNLFFMDSNKSVQFGNMGNIVVTIGSGQNIPITSLSSGESQILIMISHLMFNRAAQIANIIIIDEPELSLHIAWQELFVDSLQKTNPKLQIILATHAPSIILDRTEKCIELGK